MEYANIHAQHHHHHQLQEQINIGVVQSASSLPIISPSTLVTTTSNCNLNPSQLILNNIGNDVYPSTETIPNLRLWQSSPSTTSTFTSHQDFNYGDHHHARLSALITLHPSTAGDESPLPNSKEEEPNSDPFSKLKIAKAIYKQHQNEKNHTFRGLMSTNYSSSSPYSALDRELYSNISQNNRMNINASFGHVFNPGTINNSTSRSTATRSSIAPIMFPSLVLSSEEFMNNNTQLALDLLSPTAYNSDRSQSYSPSSQHSNNSNISGLYRDQQPIMSHGHHHDMQESRSSPSNCSNNNTTSLFFNEITRTKRPSNFCQPKESHAEANKKSKSILRSSNPPLKVRKEKLGDRIAALHRLVAPFGKADTASVLTEAIGYIQFLRDQVQTLSMPYMKSLQSKPSRKIQQVHGLRKEEETELKMDLRSRGLCLVPQSCASYLNGFD